MHRVQHVVNLRMGTVIATQGATGIVLNAADEAALRSAIKSDADDYMYSSLVSLGDAVRGIEAGFYTWSVVKLYYSVFYICRAMLAYDGYAILYLAGRPLSLKCTTGEQFAKRKGSSHKVVLDLFERVMPSSPLLSQQIAMLSPMIWLMERRELANYKLPRFLEPEVPDCLKSVVEVGLRRSVANYLGDEKYLYAFDPDHAMMAFPLLAIGEAKLARARSHELPFLDASSRRALLKIFSDRSGPLSALSAMLPA